VIKVGVLELQGGFSLHHDIFQEIGIESISVKSSSDLSKINGLVIPGGESTTMSLLIDSSKMYKPLIEFGLSNPILGTCAGLILMAKKNNDERVKQLGLLDIMVERNAYGRQIVSSQESVQFNFVMKEFKLTTTFIRAPRIKCIGDNIKILGKFKGDPIAVLAGNHLGLTFHPELNKINVFHRILFDQNCQFYYKNLIKSNAA
tara:strand:- start:74 stop:682 length:609 start_codon:yes stop_codon:yes gene_type:complete